MALAAKEAGHEVVVYCSTSSYGEQQGRSHPGVEIRRLPAIPFWNVRVQQFLGYLTFALGVVIRLSLDRGFDRLLVLTSPPILSPLVGMVAKLRGWRYIIWEMDLYPDIAVAVGALRMHSPVAIAFSQVLDWGRRHAMRVVVLGECMANRLKHSGLEYSRINIVHNWADGQKIKPLAFPPWNPLTILYSGNFGLAHDAETIKGVIAHGELRARVHFVFAGRGARVADLKKFCSQNAVTNVSFLPASSLDMLGARLSLCHVGLITQLNSTLGAVVPSKVYGLMAAGRPFIFIGPAGATVASIAEKYNCGWRIEPEDISSLIQLIQSLAVNPSLIEVAGNRGRSAFEANYDRVVGTDQILSVMGIEKSSLCNRTDS